jgi:sialate O-acetylesterase
MRFLVFLLAICSVVSAPAKVVLSSLFTDNMVLQQQTDVQIWGMASPKKTVSIRPSWDQKLYTVRADDAGMWRTSLRTPVAGGPYSISLSDGEELMLRDVLIGEVWFGADNHIHSISNRLIGFSVSCNLFFACGGWS